MVDFTLGVAVQVSVVVMFIGLLIPVLELVSVQLLHIVHSPLHFVQRRMTKTRKTMRMVPKTEPMMAPMTSRDKPLSACSGGYC